MIENSRRAKSVQLSEVSYLARCTTWRALLYIIQVHYLISHTFDTRLMQSIYRRHKVFLNQQQEYIMLSSTAESHEETEAYGYDADKRNNIVLNFQTFHFPDINLSREKSIKI